MTKKIIGAVVALALICAVAWAGVAWHSGKKIEDRINAEFALAVANAQPLMIVEQKHDRGLFSSTGRIVIGFDPECLAAQAPGNPGIAFLEGLRLAYNYKISHGPRATSIGWATIEGSLDFEGDLKNMLDQFGIPATLMKDRTRIGFDDTAYSDVEVPAWEAKLPDGSMIKAFGMKGTGQSTAGMPRKVRLDLKGDGLEVVDPQGARLVQLEPLQFKADLNYVKPQVALGTMQFTMAGASVSSPMGGPPLFSFKGADFSSLSEQSADQQLVDIGINLHVQEGAGMGFSFKNARYDFAFKRLHIDTLLQLDKLLNRSMNCAPPQDLAQMQKNMEAVSKLGVKILSYNPEFELKGLGAETSMGVFNFSGRLAARDIKEEDFIAPNPEVLKTKIIAEGKAEMPAALLQGDPHMEALLMEGLLTLEGSSVKTTFNFAEGKLTMNGKPADPDQFFARPQAAEPPPPMPSAPQPPRHK